MPGAGSAVAEKLERLGLRREADLVFHLPLRYEDETRLTTIRDALPGVPAQFEVEVISCEVAYRPRRQLVAKVRDDSGMLVLRFLNFYPSQQKALQAGARLRVFGEVRGGFFGSEIIHPRFHAVHESEPLPQGLTPVYPTTAGLGQATLRKLIDRALEHVPLDDTLPEDLRRRLTLPELAASVRTLHHPPPDISLEQLETRGHPAWRRVAFDELLAQQLSLRRAHALRRQRGAPVLAPGGRLCDALLAQLPFRLTGAQQRVWREIAADIEAPHPMQRLLQGDVGSGKTVIAALAMLRAVDNGYQAALMAPTEILAEQHYRKLSQWLQPLGLEVAWLSGSQKKRERSAWLEKVGAGDTALVVGTHALIEEGVEFANLGLAIVDEQHRFGVKQRLALKRKGMGADARRAAPSASSPPVGGSEPTLRAWGANTVPHQLTMSATPIPRTLAMSYYADLDVSVIDELPPGRTPVLTKLVSDTRREEVIARVRDACAAGRQAYWVCPLIEESEALQLKTAQETFEHLTAELPGLRIGLVHGRLKAEEKAAVMAAFVANEVQLLVATTVIEVGVDVPNATLMVIEHAERFGLAQLHQLRGRVGRGSFDSACILLYAQPLGETARARLKIIFENSDGFEISRQDLHLRGPGEFIGARQSGLPMLRYADLEDSALVEQARTAAEELLRGDPVIVRSHLERWLGGRGDLLGA
ncbi:ATP-dependent DNA helicase RecG [Sulfurisoma sediminicola]|uniref:ATP-dependent DNA helicase RecG n=1 Tax=Sulfurisoma sediminicola TaxID=1381557 RepID=UPI001A9F88AA